ncbi:MAG: cell division protein SepF [Candidatus Aenigmatarchaeota archaeon]
MSLFSRFFKKGKEEPSIEEFTEIPLDIGEETEHIKIMIEKITGIPDSDNIIKNVKNGNIVIARIKELKDTNTDELKQIISKIKTIVTGIDGDIAGVGDEWLIVTPKTARIHRGNV